MSTVKNQIATLNRNHGWVDSRDSGYVSRNLTDEHHLKLVRYVLERDSDFAALCRNSTGPVYVLATLGKYDLSLQLFRPEDISSKASISLSRTALPANSVAFRVNQNLEYFAVAEGQQRHIQTCYPHAVLRRRLIPAEIEMLNAGQLRLESGLPSPHPNVPLMTWEQLKKELESKPVTFPATPPIVEETT